MQCILWRSQPDEPITEYRLKTVTYGTKAASFLTIGCLNKITEYNQHLYPAAYKAIITDFYMDDYLGGADTVAAAITLRDEIINALNSAGFKLRKWISNDPRLLTNIENDDNDPLRILNLDGSAVKTLG